MGWIFRRSNPVYEVLWWRLIIFKFNPAFNRKSVERSNLIKFPKTAKLIRQLFFADFWPDPQTVHWLNWNNTQPCLCKSTYIRVCVFMAHGHGSDPPPDVAGDEDDSRRCDVQTKISTHVSNCYNWCYLISLGWFLCFPPRSLVCSMQ